MKARVVRFDAPGGPEVMRLETIDLPAPAAGEVQIRQTAIGLNFQEIYQRSGVYRMPSPSGLGNEAAGVVEAIGEGVTGFKAGDRVAVKAHNPPGHIRTPMYLRGKRGVVLKDYGSWKNPEDMETRNPNSTSRGCALGRRRQFPSVPATSATTTTVAAIATCG